MVETFNNATDNDAKRIVDGACASTSSLLARFPSTEAATADVLRIYSRLEPIILGETNDAAFLAVHTLLLSLLAQIESPGGVN